MSHYPRDRGAAPHRSGGDDGGAAARRRV